MFIRTKTQFCISLLTVIFVLVFSVWIFAQNLQISFPVPSKSKYEIKGTYSDWRGWINEYNQPQYVFHPSIDIFPEINNRNTDPNANPPWNAIWAVKDGLTIDYIYPSGVFPPNDEPDNGYAISGTSNDGRKYWFGYVSKQNDFRKNDWIVNDTLYGALRNGQPPPYSFILWDFGEVGNKTDDHLDFSIKDPTDPSDYPKALNNPLWMNNEYYEYFNISDRTNPKIRNVWYASYTSPDYRKNLDPRKNWSPEIYSFNKYVQTKEHSKIVGYMAVPGGINFSILVQATDMDGKVGVNKLMYLIEDYDTPLPPPPPPKVKGQIT